MTCDGVAVDRHGLLAGPAKNLMQTGRGGTGGLETSCLALGLAGLPVFAASPVLAQGAARLLGPTGGYLMAYPLAAFVAGAFGERGFDRRYVTAVLAMICGLAIVFLGGVSWLALVVQPARGFPGAVSTGLVPFIVPDVVKLLVAAGALPGLWWLTLSKDQ